MALFQLDPESIAARARAATPPARAPTLGESMLRGMAGFTVVSVAGFVPWAFFGWWFGHGLGEAAMYATCTAVFVGLSGPLMHRLIIGPGSPSRFYKLFCLAFIPYAVAWTAFWMWMPNDTGGLLGLLAGTIAMGTVLALAFDAKRAAVLIALVLFASNWIGYEVGGRVERKLMVHHMHTGMLLWGACYGIGLGAGLGFAFHRCQRAARLRLGEG